jgi:hypothetical protein
MRAQIDTEEIGLSLDENTATSLLYRLGLCWSGHGIAVIDRP